MKLVVQRVRRADVRVEGRIVGEIGRGFLVLLGAEVGDDAEIAEEAARKVAVLRVFEDGAGKMNLGLAEVAGSVLVVPQFTLAADLSRGRRPGFERALRPSAAEPLFEHFVAALRAQGLTVSTGIFGATMDVSLVNEGPATFLLDLPPR
ncbi:MAG TPA: D-aminoacyl-tRNA deacylase [Thermoanaerobaculia bacterium]